MTPGKAAVATVVALLTLVTAILKLVTVGVVALTEAIPRRAFATKVVAVKKPSLRLVKPAAGQAEQLTTALVGMGFNPSAVRRYVSTVTVTDEKPMAELIKNGLRVLAA